MFSLCKRTRRDHEIEMENSTQTTNKHKFNALNLTVAVAKHI